MTCELQILQLFEYVGDKNLFYGGESFLVNG
jgi:hypothetical protein